MSENSDSGAPKILIIGVGGAGGNTVHRMNSLGIDGSCGLVAVNTDKQQLAVISDDLIKVLIGKSITQGMGTKGDITKGIKAAESSRQSLGKILEGINFLFLTGGMGGGTSTGTLPIIADVAKQQGALVCSIVTFPFDLERSKMLKAEDGIVELSEKSDTTVVINNNRLAELVPGLPVADAFKVIDELIAKTVKGITESLTQPSLVSLNFADVKSALSNKGVGLLAFGESREPTDRIGDVVQDVLNNTLLDADVSDAKGAVLNITGGTDLTLNEAKSVGELIMQRISPEATVVWGARVREGFEGKIEVIAVFSGVPSPYRAGRFEKETGKNSSGASKYAIRGLDGKLKKGIIEV